MGNIIKVYSNRGYCRLCESNNLEEVFSLTPTPPANAFVPESKLKITQDCYPLDIYQCIDCGHVQLLTIISPNYLFQDYVYVSGTSPVFVKHFEEYANFVMSEFDLHQGSLVVEIGSNDGTLLKFFQDAGMKVLGIDPAIEIAKKAGADAIKFQTAVPELVMTKDAEKAVACFSSLTDEPV